MKTLKLDNHKVEVEYDETGYAKITVLPQENHKGLRVAIMLGGKTGEDKTTVADSIRSAIEGVGGVVVRYENTEIQFNMTTD
jgi:Flp pilus assembly CpaF family ATPase